MKYLNGLEALDLLKQGKKVRVRTWNKDNYIYFDKENNLIKDETDTYYSDANKVCYYFNGEVWEEYEKKVVDKWLNPTYYDNGGFSCECPVCHKITQTTKSPKFPNLIYYCMYCGEKNIVEE